VGAQDGVADGGDAGEEGFCGGGGGAGEGFDEDDVGGAGVVCPPRGWGGGGGGAGVEALDADGHCGGGRRVVFGREDEVGLSLLLMG